MDVKSDSVVDLLMTNSGDESPESHPHANTNPALQLADSEPESDNASLTSVPITQLSQQQPSILPQPLVPPCLTGSLSPHLESPCITTTTSILDPSDSAVPYFSASIVPSLDSSTPYSSASIAPSVDSSTPYSSSYIASSLDNTRPNTSCYIAPSLDNTSPDTSSSLLAPSLDNTSPNTSYSILAPSLDNSSPDTSSSMLAPSLDNTSPNTSYSILAPSLDSTSPYNSSSMLAPSLNSTSPNTAAPYTSASIALSLENTMPHTATHDTAAPFTNTSITPSSGNATPETAAPYINTSVAPSSESASPNTATPDSASLGNMNLSTNTPDTSTASPTSLDTADTETTTFNNTATPDTSTPDTTTPDTTTPNASTTPDTATIYTTTPDTTSPVVPTPTLAVPEVTTPDDAMSPPVFARDPLEAYQATYGRDGMYRSNMVGGGEGVSSVLVSSPPPPQQPPPTTTAPPLCHSRGDSQVSSCDPSLGRISGREYCHSRGASTDGSLMEGYNSSVIDSRRGTYSEAGTLPIGSTIIEENLQGWDRESDEKKLSPTSSSDGRKYSEKLLSSCKCCHKLLRKNHKLSERPGFCELLRYSFTCPPHGRVGTILLWLVVILAGWLSLVGVAGRAALPGGNLFSLTVLYVAAILGAEGSGKLSLPPLLGSLVAGILLSSIPGISIIGQSVDVHWSSALRSIALVIILIRAGLGLDPVALKKLSCVVLRLAFLPCLVEASATAVVSHFLLALPWLWSFMLGFIVAAVSPAVVVPCLLQLGEEGYGVDQGIPTLIIAAASMDDVLAITGFSVMLTLTFATGSLYWTIIKGPVEIVVGLVYGAVFGMLCWFLPHRETSDRPLYKFLLLLVLGMLGMFGSHLVHLKSSGPIAVLSLAFVAGLGWRQPENEDPEVGTYYRDVWQLIQPLLFVLIGAEIDVGSLSGSTIGWGLVTLFVGLTLRVLTSFLVVAGGDTFNIWERLFIAIAWLPKATVQAAIGSKALDYVRQSDSSNKEDIFRGEQVVTLAVMVILVTAPIGAAAMKFTAPRFLARRIQPPNDDSDVPV